MIKVHQILIGNIPEEVVPCIQNIKDFCKKYGYSYNTILRLSTKERGYKNLRNLCDFEKVKILKEVPYALVLDWHSIIPDTSVINFGDSFLIDPHGDNFMYNGKNTELFERLEEKMLSDFADENRDAPLYRAWQSFRAEIKAENLVSKMQYRHSN